MFLSPLNGSAELRVLEAGHAPVLCAMTRRNLSFFREWMPDFTGDYTLTESEQFIRQRGERFQCGQEVPAGIWQEGALVGVIILKAIDAPGGRASLGYYLSASHQGRGLVTEGCRILLDYAFKELGLRRVEILCAPDNTRSRAVPERLGFTLEGTLHKAQWLYDHYVDLLVYAMLGCDWQQQRGVGSQC